MKLKLPQSLKNTAQMLQNGGFTAFLVGGAVRDQLLNRKVQDYDIATNAFPEQVMKIFKRVVPTGIKHGTVTVLTDDYNYEITTFRTESIYSDFRRPDTVQWSASIDDDLKRRDFTINAIAYNLETLTIHDPFDGQNDIKNKVIKAIGTPIERFREDPLRTLRACRFAAQLDFSIDKNTLQAVKESSDLINHISAERIREEFIKIMASPLPSTGITKMEEAGLLQHIFPELQQCKGISQPDRHDYDVYHHSLFSGDFPPQQSPLLRIAALFHDIGKPESIIQKDDEQVRFYGHDKKSAEITRNILFRLKFSNREIEYITHLVKHHMFHYEPDWSDAAVRRFIHRVKEEYINDLILLRSADQYGMKRKVQDSPQLNEFQKRINNILEKDHALNLSDLAVNGADIIKELQIPASKDIGNILEELMESVLDDPQLNTRAQLIKIAHNFYNSRIKVK